MQNKHFAHNVRCPRIMLRIILRTLAGPECSLLDFQAYRDPLLLIAMSSIFIGILSIRTSTSSMFIAVLSFLLQFH